MGTLWVQTDAIGCIGLRTLFSLLATSKMRLFNCMCAEGRKARQKKKWKLRSDQLAMHGMSHAAETWIGSTCSWSLHLCIRSLATVEGEDYILTSPVITFPVTSVVGATACATVSIIDDRVLERDERFLVQITTTDPPGLTINRSSFVVTIEDNEGRSSWECNMYIMS